MTLLQKNQLNSLKSRAMGKSKRSKQEFDFDINQNISSSSSYPSVLKANSTLSSFIGNVEELLNILKGTKSYVEQLEITLNHHHLVNKFFVSNHFLVPYASIKILQ